MNDPLRQNLQSQTSNISDEQARKHKENLKAAMKKLTNVDNFLDEIWNKVDNKKLSDAVSELREAINLLN
jgi:hypothetical protein